MKVLASIAIRRGEKPEIRYSGNFSFESRKGEKAEGKRQRTMLLAFRRLRNCLSLKTTNVRRADGSALSRFRRVSRNNRTPAVVETRGNDEHRRRGEGKKIQSWKEESVEFTSVTSPGASHIGSIRTVGQDRSILERV